MATESIRPRLRNNKTLDLADGLHSSAIHLLRRLRRVDDQSGLTAPKLSALSVIVFGGPLTLGQLATAEQVTPPTITRLVRDLESVGLVKKRAHQEDGRITMIQATHMGRKRLHEGRKRRVALLAKWLDELSPRDRQTLRQATEILETFKA